MDVPQKKSRRRMGDCRNCFPAGKPVGSTRPIVGWLFIAAVLGLSACKHTESTATSAVVSAPDGTVAQVEAYVRQNLLDVPQSFEAFHWTKLTKKISLRGDTSYMVGLIYKGRTKDGQPVMRSKAFELDHNGTVLFEFDVDPFAQLR